MTAAENIDAFYARAGRTAQEWVDACDQVRPHAATMTAAYTTTPEGHVIPGLVLQVDYDGAQESGIDRLRKRFCGPRERDFCMRPQAVENVCAFTDLSGLALSTEPLADREIAPGEPIRRSWGNKDGDYVQWLTNKSRWTRRIDKLAPDPDYTSLKALRARAKALGISPLPRTKREIADLIFSHPEVERSAVDLWPISFSGGSLLILRATGSTPTGQILGHLGQAALAGRLGFGRASGPFHTGVFLYDCAHETEQLIAERDVAWDWHDARMNELGDRPERLRNKGAFVYFLGSPRRGGWNDEDQTTRYWLNGDLTSWRQRRRLSGWWTLAEIDELLDDPDALSWWDDQIADLEGDRARLVELGLEVSTLEPAVNHRPHGQPMTYRIAVKRDGQYVIDEPRVTREQVSEIAADPEQAIAAALQRKAERARDAAARKAA